jgi:hypothetical protein
MRFLRLSAAVGTAVALALPFAMQLRGQVLPVSPGVIVDNADTTGAFVPGTFKKQLQSVGYGGSTHAVFAPTYNVVKKGNVTTMTMTSVASFSFANVQPGTYSVYATWPRKGDAATLLDVRVPAAGNNYLAYSNIRVDQSKLPSSMTAAGAAWQWVYRVKVDLTGTVVVRIFPNGKPQAGTYADAVMLVREDAVSSSSQSSSASSVAPSAPQRGVVSYLPSWNVLTPVATPINCRALDTSVASYQIPEGSDANASPRGETRTESYEYQCDSAEKTRVVWITTAYPGRYTLYADWSAYPWSQWSGIPSLSLPTAVTYTVTQNGKTLATIDLSQRSAGSVADLTWKRTCYGSSRCRADLPLQRIGEIAPTETGPLVVTMKVKTGGMARAHYVVMLPIAASSPSSSSSSVPSSQSSSAASSIEGTRFTPTPGQFMLSTPLGTYIPYCTLWDGVITCSGENVPARTVWWEERLEPGTYELYADWPGNIPAAAPVTYTAYDRSYRQIATWAVDQNARSKADLVTNANCSGYSWCGSDIPFQRIGSFSVSESGSQGYRFTLTFQNGGTSRARYLLVRKISTSSSSVSSASSASSQPASSSVPQEESSSSNSSVFELPPPPAACQDGIDNDGDEKKDFPLDLGCASAQDGDERDPIADPTKNVTLTSVVANGCTVNVSYSKNFDTCVHMLVASSTQIMHSANFFCQRSGTLTLSTKDFNDLFRVGTSVKLCNGNNYNDCSAPVAIAGAIQCTSSSSSAQSVSSQASSVPVQGVALSSVTANGCSVTVAYAKNFDTCAHLIGASDSRPVHAQNFFCQRSGTLTLSTKDFNDLFRVGASVKLCNGNNYNQCSSAVAITGNAQCVSPQCSDGIDNDGDGVIDGADFSCSGQADTDESNPRSACQDGIDNDGDGKGDYPQDPGCSGTQDNEEYNASDATESSADIVLDNSMMRPDYRCTSVADTASVGGSYANCAAGTVVAWNANIAPGRYELYATWKASPDASPRAAIDLRSSATFSQVDYANFMRPVSLLQTPAGVDIGGVAFRKVGSIDLLANATMVTWGDPDRWLVGNVNKPIVIDALVLRRIGDTPYANAPADVVVLDDEYSMMDRPHASSFKVGGYRGGYAVLDPSLATSVGNSSMARFATPSIRAGMYDVLATWPTTEGATRTALVVIRGQADGGNVLLVDQTVPTDGETIDGASWKVIGKAFFPVDGAVSVLVTPHVIRSSYVPGVVLVDGFMLRRSADQTPATTFILDNEDSRFETVSAAGNFVAPKIANPSAYKGTHVILRNDAPATVSDSVARAMTSDGGRPITPGVYDVFATWVAQPEAENQVRVQVFGNTTPMADPEMNAIFVNQRVSPEGMIDNGVTWQKIGTRTIVPNTRTVYANWYTGNPPGFTPRSTVMSIDALMLRPTDGIPVASSASSVVSSFASSVASSVPASSPSIAPPPASSAPSQLMSLQLNYVQVGCSGAVQALQASYAKEGNGCAMLYDMEGTALENAPSFCGRGGVVTNFHWKFSTFPMVGDKVRLCDPNNLSSCSAPVIVTGTSRTCIAI